ncbi:MAG: hypothetical protein ACO1OF_15245 [Adhaeribacter sp.]
MKYLLTILVIITSHFYLFGQEKTSINELRTILPKMLLENVRELREQKVDTIYTYLRYCTGCETANAPEECQGFLGARVVWKKDGKTYSKQIDCNNTKVSIKESASLALNYFIKHSAEVTAREPVQKVKGKNGTTVVYMVNRGPVHHFGEQFTLILKEDVYTSSLTEFLKEGANNSKYGWVKATNKLAQLEKKE